MIKYFCDMCEKQLEEWDIFTVEVTPPEIRRCEDDAYTGSYILCRNCLKVFQNQIRRG